MIRLFSCLAAALAVAVIGCASIQGRKAREEQLQLQLDLVRYGQPLDEVWQEARRLLADQDYPLAGKDAAAVGQKEHSWAERFLSPARETSSGAAQGGLLQRLTAPSAPRPSSAVQSLDTGWNKYRERYHLEARTDDAGCQVIFTRLKADTTDRHTEAERNLEMELALLRRLDPAAAARIEASAGAAGPGGG